MEIKPKSKVLINSHLAKQNLPATQEIGRFTVAKRTTEYSETTETIELPKIQGYCSINIFQMKVTTSSVHETKITLLTKLYN